MGATFQAGFKEEEKSLQVMLGQWYNCECVLWQEQERERKPLP